MPDNVVARIGPTPSALYRTWDSFTNFLTGLGGPLDKVRAQRYSFTPLTVVDLEMAYRGDWIARKVVNIPADDATREWRAWQASNPQIEKLEELERELGVQHKLCTAMKTARLYGGAAIVIGLKNTQVPSEPLDPEKVKQGELQYLHVLSRYELVADELETDPTSEYYGEPKSFRVLSSEAVNPMQQIHPSRVVRLHGVERVSQHRRNAGEYWGDSVLDAVDEAIKAAGLVTGGVAQLVAEAKTDIIKIPGLTKNITTEGYREKLTERFNFANSRKSILNALILDGAEEWDRVQSSFSALPDILKNYLLIVCGAADIPATRFLGQSAVGLNATGESDTRNYYDAVKNFQENSLTPSMAILDEVIVRSALGTYDKNIHYEWKSLWQVDEVQKSSLEANKAKTFAMDISTGVLPEYAMAKARLNQLVEDGTYPGLEEAIAEAEALGESLEEMAEKRQEQEELQAQMLEQAANTPPGATPSGGGFPAGGAPKAKPNGNGATAKDFNPYHDERGRFTSGAEGVVGGGSGGGDEVKIVYKGREGRRTPQGYKIRFVVKTSDDKEFWSYKNNADAERQANEYIAKTKPSKHVKDWTSETFEESKVDRDESGKFSGGRGGSGETHEAREFRRAQQPVYGGSPLPHIGNLGVPAEQRRLFSRADAARFAKLKSHWADINNSLLRYVDRPDAPIVKNKMRELKGIVKQMQGLQADPGGLVGIGKPGGPKDVVIVGAGPGGLAAAIMGGAEGLDTLLVESTNTPGGQARFSSRIENFPGFPVGVTGERLTKNMFDQVERTGAQTKMGVRVVGMSRDPKSGYITLEMSDKSKVDARTVILAGGVEFRKMEFPGSDGPGVITGDPKDLKAFAKPDKNAIVIGGSNGAAQAALGITSKAKHVYIMARTSITESMSDYQVQAVRNHPKITVIEGDAIDSAERDANGHITKVKTKGGKDLDANMVGVFIGSAPNTAWIGEGVSRDKAGKIATDKSLRTAIPGVFAIGDVREGAIGRIGVAVGEGQMALRSVFDYFAEAKKAAGIKDAEDDDDTPRHKSAEREAIDQAFAELMDELFDLDDEYPFLGQTIEADRYEKDSRAVPFGVGADRYVRPYGVAPGPGASEYEWEKFLEELARSGDPDYEDWLDYYETLDYSPDQPRDDIGRWTDGGGARSETLFHATGQDFDDFKLGWRGSIYLAMSPEGAREGARAGAAPGEGFEYDRTNEPSRTSRLLEVEVRTDRIHGLELTPDEKKWWDSLPQSPSEQDIEGLMKTAPGSRGGVPYLNKWYQVYKETVHGDIDGPVENLTFTYEKLPQPRKTLAEVAKTGTDIYGLGVGHYGSQSSEKRSAETTLASGMAGHLLSDESGLAVVIADPSALKIKKRTADEEGDVKIEATSIRDVYRGEMFGTKSLRLKSGEVGAYADINIYGDDVVIQHVKTSDNAKRRGLATRLIDDLFQEFSDKRIKLSMTTPEGEAFFSSRYNIDKDGYITRKRRASDFNPYHDELGRFAEGPDSGSLKGLPDDFKPPAELATAIERGAWNIEAKPLGYEFSSKLDKALTITPPIPKGIVGFSKRAASPEKLDYYDPELADLDVIEKGTPVEFTVARPKPGLSTKIDRLDEPDIIYRGMSFEEYRSIQETGVLQSRGDYNIGEEQKGLTYWSTDPDTADAYANGFAPWQFKPTFQRPAYVVAMKRPPASDTRQIRGTDDTEVGVARPVNKDELVAVWRGDVYWHQPGHFDLRDQSRYGHGWKMGGGVSPSSSVVWRKIKGKVGDFNPYHDELGRFAEGPGGGGETRTTEPLNQSGVKRLAKSWVVEGDWDDLRHAARGWISGLTADNYVCYDCHGDDAERLEFAGAILSTINAAKVHEDPLYRGIQSGAEYKVGDKFSETLTSATSKRDLALRFASGEFGGGFGPPKGDAKPTLFEMHGSRAINLSNHLDAKEAGDLLLTADEWLTSGEYEITDIREEDGHRVVRLNRVGPVRKGNTRDLPSIGDFNPYHDEIGRFTFAAEGVVGGGSGRSGTMVRAPKDRAEWPAHVRKAKIPPAWTDVQISTNPKANLIAIGTDAKGRSQYVYSEKHAKTAAANKFSRIRRLDRQLDKIAQRNLKNTRSRDPKTRDHADALALIAVTGIRPGGEESTGDVVAYGATTLLGQHVKDGGKRLVFTGKSGVDLDLPVSDEFVSSMLDRRAKAAGDDGKLFPEITAATLRAYTQHMGGFKTKDLRTLLGTRTAIAEVAKMPVPENKTSYKRALKEVAARVAKVLGNTPAVALGSYIDPSVFQRWKLAAGM